MTDEFDVVVVGGRCAGASLATSLARQGLRVCVVDRARFPSDTPSTHFVQPSGVAVLDALGVLPRLLELAPAVTSIRIRFDDAETVLTDTDTLRTLGGPGLCVRRISLDPILLEAAANAGADVRTQTAVTGVVERDGRVAGVRTQAGEIRAALVVGADGATSTVSELVGAKKYHVTDPGRIFLWRYFDGVPFRPGGSTLSLGKIGSVAYLACPADAGLFIAAVTVDYDKRREALRQRDRSYHTLLAGWPELAARVEPATPVGPVHAMSRWHGFFRESAGPGWALVGDAGHFKDPTPGQGIGDALRQSARLGEVVGNVLAYQPQRLDSAVREWWQWRDDDAWEMYWFAHDMGAPGETGVVVREVQRRIATDPAMAQAMLRVINHDASPATLATRAIALRAVGSAVLRNPRQWRTVVSETRELASTGARRSRLRLDTGALATRVDREQADRCRSVLTA